MKRGKQWIPGFLFILLVLGGSMVMAVLVFLNQSR